MSDLIRASPAIFADTSVFCRFEETLGADGLYSFVDHFGVSLRIVLEVSRELSRHVRKERFPQLAMLRMRPLLNEFCAGAPEALPTTLAARVTQVAAGWPRRDPDLQGQNHGEIATVLIAKKHQAPAIMDDGPGREWAAERGVVTYTTRDVAVEMALTGSLSEDDAAAVWVRVFREDATRAAFDAAVAARRALLA